MNNLTFFNIHNRETDSDGNDLTDFKHEVGDEMIGTMTLDGKTVVSVSCPTKLGLYVFRDIKEGELSPYASLDELFGVKLKNGRFAVGS